MEHEGDSDTSCNWCTWHNPRRIGKETGRLGKKRKNNRLDFRIIKVGQITEKIIGNLRRLAVTQIPVKNYELTQV